MKTAGRRPGRTAASSTRTQILAAARQVFAQHGFDGASVREVAEVAHVNNAMIYYHFRDKVQLYRAVLSASFAALDQVWEHDVFAGSAPARQKIRQYVEELILFQQANDELRRIISMEFATSGRNLNWLAENLFRRSYRKLERIIREGIRNKELKNVDPAAVIAALVGMIIHSFIMRPVSELISGRKLDLSAARFGDFICGMLFDGLGGPSRKTAFVSVRRRSVTA